MLEQLQSIAWKLEITIGRGKKQTQDVEFGT